MTDSMMQKFLMNSYLSGSNAEYVEGLYAQFLDDPEAVNPPWRDFFTQVRAQQSDLSHHDIREVFRHLAKQPVCVASEPTVMVIEKQSAVDHLIESYRSFGYTHAALDPLGHDVIPHEEQRLGLAYHGLDSTDLQHQFLTRGLLPAAQAPLSEIIDQCKKVYLSAIGYDFNRMANEEERQWIRHQVESVIPSVPLSKEVRCRALHKLIAADTLERYLDKKYVAQKRFSLEGTDALVPMLDYLIHLSSTHTTEQVIIGMAHRGRVNVLLNILGLPPEVIYEDFQGPKTFGDTSGDLKYHRGYSSDIQTQHKAMHLSLMFNPSHLEYIGPVVMGSVRARQDRHPGAAEKDHTLGIVVHGDAAFSGEGIVMEALNMSQTRAHTIGGTIHLITNNQIGFTTCDLRDNRSSLTCADAAKIIDAPIFHVNADDIDAALQVLKLAFEYRMTFHKDVVIDIVGYRRHGHQEADEPAATAPIRYKQIRQHPRSVKGYAEKLQLEKQCNAEQVAAWEAEVRAHLDAGTALVEKLPEGWVTKNKNRWSHYIGQSWRAPASTAVSESVLSDLAKRLFTIPDGFQMQKQVGMVVKARQKMAASDTPMDWGFAELMAYATLASEGHHVRLVGQDSRRGTFSHRQSTWFDQNTGEEYSALQHLFADPNQVEIYDSELNESGVMGFEYGYCVADSEKLVIWEAQFGDFYNVAQVIVDQFLSSGWQKWQRLCGLVLLLPHGYEGQGPEHTSGRLERFLQLGAQHNMQIVTPTTPAQMFHLLRRQLLRPFRKPLVVMTPKSLLRHKLATSSMADLAADGFQLVIKEQDDLDNSAVKRVVICCGKVYYDLLQARRDRAIKDIAIVRVEQLYPFPYSELRAELSEYPEASQVVWCQEEPKNQGAWFVTRHRLLACLQEGQGLDYVGREPFASPATGYIGLHKIQQSALVDQALDHSFGFAEVVLDEDE